MICDHYQPVCHRVYHIALRYLLLIPAIAGCTHHIYIYGNAPLIVGIYF